MSEVLARPKEAIGFAQTASPLIRWISSWFTALSGTQLDPLRQQVLAESHRLAVVELEGHGGTPLTADRYSIAGFSANLVVAMDRAGFERAAVFGCSMGAGLSAP